MANYVLNHPWLLALILPSLLSAIPAALVYLERRFLKHLLAAGDANDQRLTKDIVKAFVKWADAKFVLPGMGEHRFDLVNRLLARALPWMSADDREKLIEAAVKELDDEAHKQTDGAQ